VVYYCVYLVGDSNAEVVVVLITLRSDEFMPCELAFLKKPG